MNRRRTAYETVLETSPLRSDQGESRTPTPVMARRSERRVSSSSTTWPNSPYGNRTHPSGMRGRRPFADRRTGHECAGQELNLHSSKAAALQAVRLASAQPTHVPSIARVGIEPTDIHQGLSLAALPVCVPCQQASPMGFEPMISTLTGWRALQAAPRGRILMAQAGFEPTASLVLSEGGLPIAYWAQAFSSGGWSRTNIAEFRARCPTG